MARIWDGFMFNNELDILEMRLNVLQHHVHRFILVEATTTHSGNYKPLYFHDNRKRFEPFLDKINHVVLSDLPRNRDNRWPAEHMQRTAIMRGLSGCDQQDYVAISDVDDIWNPAKVPQNIVDPVSYILDVRQWCINTPLMGRVPWSCMARRSWFDENTPQHIRDECYAWRMIQNGGWSFSWVIAGDIDGKAAAFSHAEVDTEAGKEFWINKHRECLSRPEVPGCMDTLPDYIRENAKTKYKHLCLP